MLANGEGKRFYGKCHRKENADLEVRGWKLEVGEIRQPASADPPEAKLKRWCKRPPVPQ